MTLTIQINADTPDELARAVQALAKQFEGVPHTAAIVGANADLTTVKVAVDPTVLPPLPPATTQPTAGDTAGSTEPAPQANVVKDKSPAEMRSEATMMLMALFNRDAANATVLRKLQAKFGVKKFDEIPDNRAQEFYQDALLATNGTTEKSE